MNISSFFKEVGSFTGYLLFATAIMLGIPLAMYLSTMWFV